LVGRGGRPLRGIRWSTLKAGVCLLLALALHPSAAASIVTPEMSFEGNRRTRTAYLRSLVGECLEDQGVESLEEVDAGELEQCLLNSELFSQVTVSIDAGIAVAVRERWTLIPLPYFRSQEDSKSAGAFLMESNFLGRGQRLVLGATFGDLGNTYFFLLRDPSVAFSDWTSRVLYLQEVGDIFRYEGEEKVEGFHQKERTVSVAPGYQFTRALEGRVFVGYTDREYRETDSFGGEPDDYRFWTAGLGLELDGTDYKFYFREGHKADLRVLTQVARSGGGERAHSYEFEWEWGRPLIGRSVAKLVVESVGTSSDDAVDSFKLGGRGSLRGVQDKGLWAQYVTGAVIDYHIPVGGGRLGTWAGGPFFAYALYRPPEGVGEDGWRQSMSYGLGLFFYLKRIAFPGVGVVVGRNEDFSGSFVTAQVGFGF